MFFGKGVSVDRIQIRAELVTSHLATGRYFERDAPLRRRWPTASEYFANGLLLDSNSVSHRLLCSQQLEGFKQMKVSNHDPRATGAPVKCQQANQ